MVPSLNKYLIFFLAFSEQEGHVCSDQCSGKGCWGAGNAQCLSCANFELEGQCVADCNPDDGVYQQSDKICARCHEECAGSCNGSVRHTIPKTTNRKL